MIRSLHSSLGTASRFARLARTLVYRREKPRNIFDKTSYTEDWVPREKKFHPNRKPRLPQWDDPKVIWPPVSSRPTKLTGEALLHQLRNEEKNRLQLTKVYTMPDFRPGDVIRYPALTRFHYLHSLSEGNGNTITALCIGRDGPNSLNGSFTAVFNFAGVPVKMKVKHNSPFLSNLVRVMKGSGDLKQKLNYIWHTRKASVPVAPIIKRTMRRRRDEKKASSAKDPQNSFMVDKITDPLIVE